MFEISEAEVVARLHFDNPWWGGHDLETVSFHGVPRRKYFASFYKAATDRSVRRALILMGPRRVGKTVMVFQAIHDLLAAGVPGRKVFYLSMETPLYSGLRLDKLLSLFTGLFNIARDEEIYVFFDEIQYLKNWEIHLKSLVDSFPSYKFIATGSAAAALRMKSNESGAGRFTDFILPPLTFAEFLQFINREEELIAVQEDDEILGYSSRNVDELNKEFIRYLNFGGYPEAVFSETVQKDPTQYIKADIIDKVLLRDLPSLYGISDIQELNRLFTVLAYNSGMEVSLEALSKSSGVAKNTIKKYMEYLEAAFLIKKVERIDQNARRFKRARCFKVYLTNASMRSALFGKIDDGAEAMGLLTETAIFSQWQHSDQTELFYARWDAGEIDIVSIAGENQAPVWVVEVKWSDRPAQDYSLLRHCVEFSKRHPHLKSFLVTTKTIDAETTYQGLDIEFKPSSLYAYVLGANILKNKRYPPGLIGPFDVAAPQVVPEPGSVTVIRE